MKIFKIILTLFAITIISSSATAQFYSWGADPISMHWKKIKGDNYDIISPDTAIILASSLNKYVEAVKGDIGFGFRHGPMKIPFVIHPENFESNGLVMWLPKRVEILSSPAVSSYSMPWLKQLAAHEYRHAVQYNNLNRAWVRGFSYILGQQSSTIGLMFMPLWGIEGDAVLSETQMSSFGRALQPSFTIEYRALGEELLRRRNLDKWFCGSFRENIPDHYHLGYQLTAYADTKYDENIWDKIIHYAVRRPYFICTTSIALKKYWHTSTNNLLRETYTDLLNHWNKLPQVSDSAIKITVKPTSYATYRYPLPFADHIIACRYDLDRSPELVSIDKKSGEQKRLCYTGAISSRPTQYQNHIYWTEYRRSTFYEERVRSRLIDFDMDKGKAKVVRGMKNILYPTSIETDTLAWVEYMPSGQYNIVRGTLVGEREKITIPFGTEIHGLAYDNNTKKIYFIATADSGMWIGKIENDKVCEVTKPAYITLSDLSANGGKLYFGSIASGKDEIHCLNLNSGKEYQLTTSKFGSFNPNFDVDNNQLLLTTYDSRGYLPAVQEVDSTKYSEVKYSLLPKNILNPTRKDWNLVNLDSVKYNKTDSVAERSIKRGRFSKFTHLFNFHSWAPISYDPFELSEDNAFNFNLGATLMSQNILSNCEGFLTWAWNHRDGSFYKATFRYFGLGLNIGISAAYGGKQQIYDTYAYKYNPNNKRYEIFFPVKPKIDKYYSIRGSLSLPLYLSSGHYTRYLAISTSWNYSNGLVAKLNKTSFSDGNISNLAIIGYKKGMHTLQFGTTYQCLARLSHKDIVTPLGAIFGVTYALNPSDEQFSDLISAYTKFYLPGFVPHNSIAVSLCYQNSFGGFFNKYIAADMSYHTSQLIPHGFEGGEINSHNYFAGSISYLFPFWYPEGGIQSFLYFKRISARVGFDYASFGIRRAVKPDDGGQYAPFATKRKNIYSYGGELIFDVNIFRMPAKATTQITLSLYKPNKRGVHFSCGVGLPF